MISFHLATRGPDVENTNTRRAINTVVNTLLGGASTALDAWAGSQFLRRRGLPGFERSGSEYLAAGLIGLPAGMVRSVGRQAINEKCPRLLTQDVKMAARFARTAGWYVLDVAYSAGVGYVAGQAARTLHGPHWDAKHAVLATALGDALVCGAVRGAALAVEGAWELGLAIGIAYLEWTGGRALPTSTLAAMDLPELDLDLPAHEMA